MDRPFTLYNVPKEFFSPKSDPAPIIITNSSESVTPQIEISGKYRKTGANILSQFAAMLNRKYTNESINTHITQNGLKIRMTILSEGREEEIIEASLDDDWIISPDELSLEDCLKDKDLILELRTEIKEMISSAKDQRNLIKDASSQIEMAVAAITNEKK